MKRLSFISILLYSLALGLLNAKMLKFSTKPPAMPPVGKPDGQVSRIFTNPLLHELEFGAWDLGF